MSNDRNDRSDARQTERFNPAHAAGLDDPARFAYLPPIAVLRMLDVPVAGTALDFGTGTGAYAIALAQERPDIEMIAFDEQPEMLDVLRAKPVARQLTNLKIVSSSRVGAYKETIDRVLALNVLHELDGRALQTILALLKGGGSALFIDWNAEVDRSVGPPANRVYSSAEGRALLERAGFTVETEKPFPYHYALRARRVA